MGRIAIIFGVLLMVLGVAFYVATDMASATALIPAGFGFALFDLGLIASRGGEKVRMHTMHAAALLGLVGAVMPVVMIFARGMSGPALWENVLMAVLSAVFVALCVKSFIDARRRRGGMGAP